MEQPWVNLAESRDGGRRIASFSIAPNFTTATTIASRPAGQLRVADISCAIAHFSVSPVLRHHRGIRSLCPYFPSSSVTGESLAPNAANATTRRRHVLPVSIFLFPRNIFFPLPKFGGSRCPV